MKYKIYYKECMFYEDTIEISDKRLEEFYGFLVESGHYTWEEINRYRELGYDADLIEEYVELFRDILIFNPITSSDLEGIKVTEEE